jgi:hypothetical protein
VTRPTHSRVGKEGLPDNSINTSFEVGKYLVSPLSRRLDDGQYSAAVSIKTGRGRATHDRILRFVPVFDSLAAAIHYASEQGLGWLAASAACPTPQIQHP